jgi:hypothetical protein
MPNGIATHAKSIRKHALLWEATAIWKLIAVDLLSELQRDVLTNAEVTLRTVVHGKMFHMQIV